MEKQSHKTLLAVLIFISYFTLMFQNGIISLTHPDEVFYIQTAKEMVQHNSWLTPMIFDEPQFEKPILAYFLFAVAIKLFGLAPFVTRFWPSFFGMVGVCAVYWIAWLLFGRKRTAFLSGLILSTSFIYLALSRAILTDMIFSVFVALSIGSFVFAYFHQKHLNSGMFLCFAFSGLAVLTKGLLGICFPLAVVLIYLTYRKDLKFLLTKGTLWGGLAFIVIALPWHVLMYMNHGKEFIDEYFHNVHVRRLFEAEHRRLDNWYFYIGLMFAGILPWSFFWPPAIKRMIDQFRNREESRKKTVFLLSWIVGIYVFVQPAHSKLASYIFPTFFAIAILLADYLDSVLAKAEEKKPVNALQICGYVFLFVITGVIIGGIIAGKTYIDVLQSMVPIYIFAALLVMISLANLFFNITKRYDKMVYSYCGVTAALLMTLFFAKPYTEPWVSCKDISDMLKKIDHENTTILASKFYVRGVRYYTDHKMAVIDNNGSGFFSPHPIPFLNSDDKIYAFLESQPVTYAVVKEGDKRDLTRITRDRPYQMEQLGYSGGKYIIKLQRNDN